MFSHVLTSEVDFLGAIYQVKLHGQGHFAKELQSVSLCESRWSKLRAATMQAG